MKGQLRFNSGMALLDTAGKGADFIMAEVALPLSAIVLLDLLVIAVLWQRQKVCMTLHAFSNYGFNEWTQVHLRIPTRETHFQARWIIGNLQGVEEL